MMNRAVAAFLVLGLAVTALPVEAPAQTDRYLEIASSRRSSPVYYEAFVLPGLGEKEVVIVSYKVPHDRLVFMRYQEGGAGQAFRAGLDVMVEIFKDGDPFDSVVLKKEAFAPDYEATIDPLQGVAGAVTFQVEPGTYGFRLQITDQNTSRTAASLVRPITVPDYPNGALGKAFIAANVDESDLFRSIKLSSLGGDANFGKGAVAVIPFTLGPESADPKIEWTLRRLDQAKVEEERKKRSERIRHSAEKGDESVGIRVEEDEMLSSEGGVPVDSGIVMGADLVPLKASVPVDILPDKVRLTEAAENPDYYAAIIDLRGERLENGAYSLDVRLSGSSAKPQTTRFDTNWPDMPFSLFDVDIAIRNMEFILSKDDLKALRKGSRTDKMAQFRAFWDERDPTPETAYNELMVEYFKRIDYAALEFRTGAGMIPNGLKTDRAKVYIVHGPPEDISRSFPDQGGVLETWKYDNGRTFTFQAVSSIDPFYIVDGS
ncbi:MAG: GWxTD domain-containing protein [Rhodothermia bacterium]